MAPKFAPYHYPIVTLYDTMKIGLDENWIPKPNNVSFTMDILPILYRITQYKSLSRRAHAGHGDNSGCDFLKNVKILSDNANQDGAIERKNIFSRIRNPNHIDPDTLEEEKMAIEQAQPEFMPPLSGDDDEMNPGNFKSWMKLHMFQYEMLKRWAEGDFISDWNENLEIAENKEKSLEVLPIEEQPFALDRAGLELSIGAPLIPGIEASHHFYKKEFYDGKAFRIISTLKLGSITQQMAIPWQSDFYACAKYWWPTARPDDVYAENTNASIEWARGVDGKTDMADKGNK